MALWLSALVLYRYDPGLILSKGMGIFLAEMLYICCKFHVVRIVYCKVFY